MGKGTSAALVLGLLLALPAPAMAAAPVAYDDQVDAVENQTAAFNVLANDIDPDGDPLTVSQFPTSSVEGGQVSCETDGDCTYYGPGGPTPYQDSFEYTVSDGTSSDTATVAITVTAPDPGGGGGDGGGDGGGGGSSNPAEKQISLRLRGELVARGAVTSTRPRCVGGEVVKVFIRDMGYWNLVKKTTTSAEGRYRVRIPHRFGRYRAQTSQTEACNGDYSPIRSYLTNDPQTVTDGDDISGFLDIAKVRIDHDGFGLHFKWTAHNSWQLSQLQGGRRLGVYLFYGAGYYSIDIDMGQDLPIVAIVPCSGSPGSGQPCNYDNLQYGTGEKAGPRAMTFQLPLRHLGSLGNTFDWRGHSASEPGSGFDLTAMRSYSR